MKMSVGLASRTRSGRPWWPRAEDGLGEPTGGSVGGGEVVAAGQGVGVVRAQAVLGLYQERGVVVEGGVGLAGVLQTEPNPRGDGGAGAGVRPDGGVVSGRVRWHQLRQQSVLVGEPVSIVGAGPTPFEQAHQLAAELGYCRWQRAGVSGCQLGLAVAPNPDNTRVPPCIPAAGWPMAAPAGISPSVWVSTAVAPDSRCSSSWRCTPARGCTGRPAAAPPHKYRPRHRPAGQVNVGSFRSSVVVPATSRTTYTVPPPVFCTAWPGFESTVRAAAAVPGVAGAAVSGAAWTPPRSDPDRPALQVPVAAGGARAAWLPLVRAARVGLRVRWSGCAGVGSGGVVPTHPE